MKYSSGLLLFVDVLVLKGFKNEPQTAIGTASANSVESDLGCTSRIFFDNVTLALHNVRLTSQKPCQNNNKWDCSKRNGYK